MGKTKLTADEQKSQKSTNLENIFFGRKFECFIKASRAQRASA